MKSGDNMMIGMLHVVLDTDIATGDRLYCEVDHNTCGEQDEPTIALSWCRKGSSPDESNIGYWFVPVSVMRKLCDLVESSHALGDMNWKRSEEGAMRCKDCGGEIRDDEVVLVSNVCPECERRRSDG